MKTERRHELQTNRLADWLGHRIDEVQPHGKKILAVVIISVAVIITGLMIAKDRQTALEDARNDFYLALSARDREALATVAKTHAGTVVALWATLAQADLDLSNGITALYTNREDAFRSLDEAKSAYTFVMNGASSYPELMSQALYGLAQVNEATSNLDRARELYEKIVKQYPSSDNAARAKERLEDLKDPQLEKWYAWFSRQTPKPRGPMSGMPGMPGMPNDLMHLPDSPNFPNLPLSPDSTTPPAAPETPTGEVAPGADKKDGGTDTPASDANQAEKPASPAPTGEKKDSVEKADAGENKGSESKEPAPENNAAESDNSGEKPNAAPETPTPTTPAPDSKDAAEKPASDDPPK